MDVVTIKNPRSLTQPGVLHYLIIKNLFNVYQGRGLPHL